MLLLAAQAERMAEKVYHEIGARFIQVPELAAYWNRYADEEAGHARWMENLHRRLDPAQRDQPANSDMWGRINRLIHADASELLNHIHTLQDAWDLTNEMEHGETNIIFEFLIAHFSKDPYTMAFLRMQLKEHIGHLMVGLPVPFNDTAIRRATLAAK